MSWKDSGPETDEQIPPEIESILVEASPEFVLEVARTKGEVPSFSLGDGGCFDVLGQYYTSRIHRWSVPDKDLVRFFGRSNGLKIGPDFIEGRAAHIAAFSKALRDLWQRVTRDAFLNWENYAAIAAINHLRASEHGALPTSTEGWERLFDEQMHKLGDVVVAAIPRLIAMTSDEYDQAVKEFIRNGARRDLPIINALGGPMFPEKVEDAGFELWRRQLRLLFLNPPERQARELWSELMQEWAEAALPLDESGSLWRLLERLPELRPAAGMPRLEDCAGGALSGDVRSEAFLLIHDEGHTLPIAKLGADGELTPTSGTLLDPRNLKDHVLLGGRYLRRKGKGYVRRDGLSLSSVASSENDRTIADQLIDEEQTERRASRSVSVRLPDTLPEGEEPAPVPESEPVIMNCSPGKPRMMRAGDDKEADRLGNQEALSDLENVAEVQKFLCNRTKPTRRGRAKRLVIENFVALHKGQMQQKELAELLVKAGHAKNLRSAESSISKASAECLAAYRERLRHKGT